MLKLLNCLWYVLLTLLLFLALYVTASRYGVSWVQHNSDIVRSQLSIAIGQPVVFDELKARWNFFSPSISLHGLRLVPQASSILEQNRLPVVTLENEADSAVSVDFIHLGLNIFASLFSRQPQFSFIHISGVDIAVEVEKGRMTRIIGLPDLTSFLANKQPQNSLNTSSKQSLRDRFLPSIALPEMFSALIERKGVILQNIKLEIRKPQFDQDLKIGVLRTLLVNQLSLVQSAGQFRFSGNAKVLDKALPVDFSFSSILQGHIPDPKTWSGVFFGDFGKMPMDVFAKYLPIEKYVLNDGDAKITVWGDIREGKSSRLVGKVALTDISIGKTYAVAADQDKETAEFLSKDEPFQPAFQEPLKQKLVSLDAVESEFYLTTNLTDQLRVAFSDFSISHNDQRFLLERAYVEYLGAFDQQKSEKGSMKFSLQSASIDLDRLFAVVLDAVTKPTDRVEGALNQNEQWLRSLKNIGLKGKLQATELQLTMQYHKNSTPLKPSPSQSLSPLPSSKIQLSDWQFSTRFEAVSVEPLSLNESGFGGPKQKQRYLPGVNQLNGFVSISDTGGIASLKSQSGKGSTFNLKGIMPEPVAVDTFTADLLWDSTTQGVHIDTGVIQVANKDASAALLGSLWLPSGDTQSSTVDKQVFVNKAAKPDLKIDFTVHPPSLPSAPLAQQLGSISELSEALPHLTLQASIVNGNGNHVQSYLPKGIMAPPLYKWLSNSIVGGDLKQGNFLFRGALSKKVAVKEVSTTTSRTKKTAERRSAKVVKSERLKEGVPKVFQMQYIVEDASLQFLPDWPILQKLNGEVLVKGRETDISISKGVFNSNDKGGLILGPSTAQIPDFPKNGTGVLQIDAVAKGNLSEGIHLLQNSPIRSRLPDLIDQVSGGGEMSLVLDLQAPLRKGIPVQTNVKVDVKKSNLRLLNLNLEVSDIRGSVVYDSNKGLRSAGELKGTLFSAPISADILSFREPAAAIDFDQMVQSSQTATPAVLTTEVLFDSAVPIPALQKWLPVPVLDFVQGALPYSAKLSFHRGESALPPLLTISSNLEGVGITLPLPLAKIPEQKKPLSFSWFFLDQPEIELSLDDQLRVTLGLDKGRSTYAHYQFGREPLSQARLQSVKQQNGVSVDGELAIFDVDAWLDFATQYKVAAHRIDQEILLHPNDVQRLPRNVGSQEVAAPWYESVIRFQLKADKLLADVLPMDLTRVDVQISPLNKTWFSSLRSQQLSSTAKIPVSYLKRIDMLDADIANQPKRWFGPEFNLYPIRIDVDHLVLPDIKADQLSQESASTLTKTIQDSATFIEKREALYTRLPPFRLKLNDLKIGEDSWGAWSVNNHYSENGWEFTDLSARFKEMTLTGQAIWQANSLVTQVSGQVAAKNIAAALAAFEVPGVIESNKGILDLQLQWLGSPLDFTVLTADGDLSLTIDQGRLPRLDPKTQSVRVLGLLNFETLFKRMQLDFSDILETGLAFNTIEGVFSLSNGVLTTKTLQLFGPSAEFSLSGEALLAQKTLNQQLNITLPVTRNLVLPAAAAGGLPAATAAFVLEKALGDKLNKLTTLNFTVKGDWGNPIVKPKKSYETQEGLSEFDHTE